MDLSGVRLREMYGRSVWGDNFLAYGNYNVRVSLAGGSVIYTQHWLFDNIELYNL